MHIDQSVLTAMTDEEMIDLHLYRQIRFPFVGMVKQHRMLMERREVKPFQLDIIVRLIIGDDNAFMQHMEAERRDIKHDCYYNKQQKTDL